MSKQIISSGAAANDRTGDNLRNSAGKINANFNELYSALGNGTQLSVSQVAKTGNYNDLSNKPTIPTDVSQLADTSGLLGASANLGAFKIEGNTLGTAAEGGGWGASGMNLSPDGEGYTWINIPSNSIAANGGSLAIGNTSSSGGGIQLLTNGGYWTFRNDSVLQLPANGDIVDINGNSVLGGTSITDNITLAAPDSSDLYDIYQESLMVLNDNFVVANYTGLGYPASKNSYDQILRAKAVNPLIPDAWIPLSKTVQDNYFGWAASTTSLTANSSGFTIQNADNVGWRFEEATGLRFPDNTFQNTAFTGVSPIANRIVSTDSTTIKVVSDTEPDKIWTFDSTGNLNVPGFISSDIGFQFNATGNNNLQSVWTHNVPAAHPYPTNPLLNATAAIVDIGYTGVIVEVNTEDRSGIWRFAPNGQFRIPPDGDITDHAGNSLLTNTMVVRSTDAEITNAQVNYDNYVEVWANWMASEEFTSYPNPGWTFTTWQVDGTNVDQYLAELTTAWQIQNTPSSPPSPLVFEPAIAFSLYTQLRSVLILIKNSYELWQSLLSSVDVIAGTTKLSVLGNDKLVTPEIIQTTPDEDLTIRTRYTLASSPPGSTPSYQNLDFKFGTNGALTFPNGTTQYGAAIDLVYLKSIIASSVDFNDFKNRIASL